MPIAGSYKSIDFALSNMSNSHIKKVAVLTQYRAESLNQHLNSSKWWDFGRKQGGLYILTPSITEDNSYWYRGTADAIYQNLEFLKNCHEPYVILSSGDCVYKMDYNKVIEAHIHNKADITVVYKNIEPERDDVTRFGVLKVMEDGRISEFEEKPLEASNNLISTGVYVIRRRYLMELIEKSNKEGRYDFVQDILVRYCGQRRFFGYRHEDYWSNIATVASYYKTNMDFLKKDIRDYFFKTYPSIYSKVSDMPPAKYNPGANINNSLISGGCIINGEVENSILFKKVFVGNNCTIKNSIILDDVYIGDNTTIENCIVESGNTIKANASYIGEEGNIKIVIEGTERYII